MKCLILAGGRGERLWPLSRKNYPKQFIQIQNNHSIFQETVARNIPYCDEFIIVTSYEYRFIIENQMKAFQGTAYRCVFEERPRKTTSAVLLACMDLQPSEYVFVVAADHIIDSKSESDNSHKNYQDAILKAKEYAKNGYISLFGEKEIEVNSRYGYIDCISDDYDIKHFVIKPDRSFLNQNHGVLYRNLGMMLFVNGHFQHELSKFNPEIYLQCKKAYQNRNIQKNYVYYPLKVQQSITPVSIEESLVEKTNICKLVVTGFEWNDLGRLEDLEKTKYKTEGVNVINSCANTTIINNSANQAVVVNDLDSVIVVNTPDAVYVGRYGKSGMMKEIFQDYPELKKYSDHGTIYYRPWGYYNELVSKPNYRIRQVYILPGKTIYAHRHSQRNENWAIVQGKVRVVLDNVEKEYSSNDCIQVSKGIEHQISNIGSETALFIETAVGELQNDYDMESTKSGNLTENQLGRTLEPMVKLQPAFKDYIWGGTKLRDIYHMPCDYDIIAESWQLSAHPAGQSIIGSGRHKGITLSEYLDVVGREVLGWKCAPLKSFPLLIKFIDAKQNLSVQVHPNDDYALEHENEYGKNEMWYVIDTEPGAGLYVGFNKDISPEEISESIKNNTIMTHLNFFPTKPGDVFFIPAGTIHAIGAGNLICEIQQSSNCTYRLYDYDRRDKFGHRRELHLKKALDVLNFKKYELQKIENIHCNRGAVLGRCKYFEAVLYKIRQRMELSINETMFNSLVCIKGSGIISCKNTVLKICAGESIFIPAQNGKILLEGNMDVIKTNV